jgi:hypothetical protein
MMTRAERKAANKRAHAIRRELTDADYRQAKRDGHELTWREVWDTYAGISPAVILSDYATLTEPVATVEPVARASKGKRPAPAHIQALSAEYRLAREAWQAGLDAAIAGGRSRANGGKPARGERWTDEERDYRAAHPAPVWRDFLANQRVAA